MRLGLVLCCGAALTDDLLLSLLSFFLVFVILVPFLSFIIYWFDAVFASNFSIVGCGPFQLYMTVFHANLCPSPAIFVVV